MKSIDEINEDLIKEHFKTDLKIALQDFQETVDLLSDLFFQMGDAKIELESWQELFEAQLVKFIYLSGSMIKLASGTPIKNFRQANEISNFDINALYIIARSQIECYLMFYYSQINISSNDEGEFKYYLFVLSGLTHRQNITLQQ
jgi:hypothetical protein